MEDFDRDVWPKIIKILKEMQDNGEPVETTGVKNKNWIMVIKHDEIIVRSEKNERGQPNGSPRPVSKWALKEVWTILQKDGEMTRETMYPQVADENQYRRCGAVVLGILALLPSVSVKKIGRISTLFYHVPKNG